MSKLTDKAKSISFDDEDEAPAAAPAPVDRPRTAMGAISARSEERRVGKEC